MYFYPDNVTESILIFQKGRFDYKSINSLVRERSRIDLAEFDRDKWSLNCWRITNVLPNSNLEKGIAAYPAAIPNRLIRLYSYVGETILDPFLGSSTTMAQAKALGRNSIGLEINRGLEPVIREKTGFEEGQMSLDTFKVIYRS